MDFMAEENERIIGTFLYAVSFKAYELHHLIFTSRRLIMAISGWEKISAASEFGNIVGMLIVMMPLPNVDLKIMLMQRWADIKRENREKATVNYQDISSEKILGLGFLKMAAHEISAKPYARIKKIGISEYPVTGDYKIKIEYLPFGSAEFLIPDYSIAALKELVSKTPVAAYSMMSFIPRPTTASFIAATSAGCIMYAPHTPTCAPYSLLTSSSILS